MGGWYQGTDRVGACQAGGKHTPSSPNAPGMPSIEPFGCDCVNGSEPCQSAQSCFWSARSSQGTLGLFKLLTNTPSPVLWCLHYLRRVRHHPCCARAGSQTAARSGARPALATARAPSTTTSAAPVPAPRLCFLRLALSLPLTACACPPTGLNATVVDPRHRTLNRAAPANTDADVYRYNPWRRPGARFPIGRIFLRGSDRVAHFFLGRGGGRASFCFHFPACPLLHWCLCPSIRSAAQPPATRTPH